MTVFLPKQILGWKELLSSTKNIQKGILFEFVYKKIVIQAQYRFIVLKILLNLFNFVAVLYRPNLSHVKRLAFQLYVKNVIGCHTIFCDAKPLY